MKQASKDISVAEKKEGNDLFPVFLKLENLRLLLVGGGKVGLEKLHAVIHNSPATRINLVASEVNPEIRTLAEQYDTITIHERVYDPIDLDDCDIAIVAVNDTELSERIFLDAKSRNKLINVADDPARCERMPE